MSEKKEVSQEPPKKDAPAKKDPKAPKEEELVLTLIPQLILNIERRRHATQGKT
jgi:hypothetical protein